MQDVAPGPPSSSPRELAATAGRLFWSADDGLTGRELWSLPLAGPGGCQPAPGALCLGGGRFKVEVDWRTSQGATGTGQAVPLTADTGAFWFFSAANVELVVKVLDGRGLNGHFWVFYGALSNVEYTLTVTDTQTGASHRYFNPAGQFGSYGDTRGFGPLGAYATQAATRAEAPEILALASERIDPAAATPCHAGPTRLCLAGGRFAVEAVWKDFQGKTGVGPATGLTADTGTFWFFNPENLEVIVKLVDGRPVNGKYWFFYGALSNVEYTLTVTDTQTGAVRTYKNPSGRFASAGDTSAF